MRILRTLAPFAALALPLAVASCSAGGTASSATALPMQQHWAAGNALQHAMARGDLTAARRAAVSIAEVTSIPGLTWDASPYLNRMLEEAQTVASSANFTEAAGATGRMAAACGACHARGDAMIRLEASATPPEWDPEHPEYHMRSHTWAMDRMWEGLVLPSRDRWIAGARLLAEQPVAATGMPPEVSLMAARVHEMGRQGLEDRDAATQADRFGRILVDCAGCHAELGLD